MNKELNMKSIFNKATNEQAYLKAGFMGFTGSGKTYTAAMIAEGLHHLLVERKLPGGNAPIFFADTETGSDWVRDILEARGAELQVAKTRAFTDLIPMVHEVAKVRGILLIDSITHFWRELTESYAVKKKRTNGLMFQDWDWLKRQWGKFTDEFVNSPAHILMCGRAGYEYDFFENDAGKKELEKTGIKMKAEGETGYEPSILVLMSMHKELQPDNTQTVWRTATVLKDRGRTLDGKQFKNPTFETFLPHIEKLNLGGTHRGVDTTRDSSHIVSPNERSQYAIEKQQVEIALEEIKELLVKHFPGQSADAKEHKAALLEKHFQTRAWAKVESYSLQQLREGRNAMWIELEGRPYDIADEANAELETTAPF